MLLKVHANSFVKRQTDKSRFSHSVHSWETICDMIVHNFDEGRPGTTKGTLEVPLPIDGMYTGVVLLKDGDSLSGVFESRHKSEAPRKAIGYECMVGEVNINCTPGVRFMRMRKEPAKSVYAVLYPSCVLAKDSPPCNELRPMDGNWELVSLNASPVEQDTPICPDTLMHNHFGSAGGSATGMSPEEFVMALKESFVFWKDKAMCQ